MQFYQHPPKTPTPPSNTFSKGFVSGALTEAIAAGGGVAAPTPFLVFESLDNADPPNPILQVFPGTIATKMPYLYQPGIADPDTPDPTGPRLDKDINAGGQQPFFYLAGITQNFSLFLWVHMKVVFPIPVTYQSHIDFVQVLSDDDPIAVPDIDPMSNEIPEYFPIWEGDTQADKDLHTKGHFYIKLADVSVDDQSNVTNLQQFLYTNLLTFVVAGTQVIVMV